MCLHIPHAALQLRFRGIATSIWKVHSHLLHNNFVAEAAAAVATVAAAIEREVKRTAAVSISPQHMSRT